MAKHAYIRPGYANTAPHSGVGSHSCKGGGSCKCSGGCGGKSGGGAAGPQHPVAQGGRGVSGRDRHSSQLIARHTRAGQSRLSDGSAALAVERRGGGSEENLSASSPRGAGAAGGEPAPWWEPKDSGSKEPKREALALIPLFYSISGHLREEGISTVTDLVSVVTQASEKEIADVYAELKSAGVGVPWLPAWRIKQSLRRLDSAFGLRDMLSLFEGMLCVPADDYEFYDDGLCFWTFPPDADLSSCAKWPRCDPEQAYCSFTAGRGFRLPACVITHKPGFSTKLKCGCAGGDPGKKKEFQVKPGDQWEDPEIVPAPPRRRDQPSSWLKWFLIGVAIGVGVVLLVGGGIWLLGGAAAAEGAEVLIFVARKAAIEAAKRAARAAG